MDEFLDSLIEQKKEASVIICSMIDQTHDDWLKEFEKFAKLMLRARKTNNYNSLNKFVETARYKEIFGYNNETIPNNVEKETCIVNVKKEKISLTTSSSVQSVVDDGDMPAPKMPPPKKKRVKKEKVSNDIKIKQEPNSDMGEMEKRVTRSRVDRSSDVILENPVIPVIELDDSSDKIEEAPLRSTRTRTIKKEETAPIRNTRTRTKKVLEENEGGNDTVRSTKTRAKRDRSDSEAEKKTVEAKRSKSATSTVKEKPDNDSTHTEYEDALSQLDNKTNATFICTEKEPLVQKNVEPTNMNATVIIEKSKPVEIGLNNHNDLLTDDESIEEQVNNSKKINKQAPNQVFSPYENSPVKKKVEAFEKFQKKENTTTSKMNTSRILKEIESNRGNVKEKAKGFIENSSSTVYKTNPPSASKIGKYIGNKSPIRKIATPKSGHEFKDRELKRQEKERVLKKKEMLKQTLTEERKKKYEEKIMRVQQHQKEALEKEKEKALELQRLKEERYKMVLQQKEEKQRLLKEENERRRLLAKQRAEEKRKEEEALKMGEKKDNHRRLESEKKNPNSPPIYMTQPLPPLPCDDCYDSDDDRFNRTKQIPLWATKSKHQRQDHLQNILGHKIKNTLFCCKSQDIDLRAVFQSIDPKKLKRTSSAHWEKPPRFTILPSAFD